MPWSEHVSRHASTTPNHNASHNRQDMLEVHHGRFGCDEDARRDSHRAEAKRRQFDLSVSPDDETGRRRDLRWNAAPPGRVAPG
jgi:hypothetical protein